MGTSRAYEPPKNGDWPKLKNQINNFGNGAGGDPISPDQAMPLDNVPLQVPGSGPTPLALLGQYIQAQGGSSAIMGGIGRSGSGGGGGGTGKAGGGARGTGSGGRPTGAGRTASRIGRNLGGFATRVTQVGLAEALRELDLGDLVGRPAGEVARALFDRLAGPGSTMDAVLARKALDSLRRELLNNARTFEDVENSLQTIVQELQVSGLVMQYYGYYLFERFNRDFYERLLEKVGNERARNASERIRRTILDSLKSKLAGLNPSKFKWSGKEGRQLADSILEITLRIFERGA